MTKRQAKPTNKKKYVSDFPKLVDEWHPTQNGDLKPENFTKGSHEIIQWQCKKVINHIYPMAIYNKVQGKNCSYCSGQKVHENNSFASNYPELSIEWHPTKNGKNLPHHFTKSSNEIVWWQCKKAEDHS